MQVEARMLLQPGHYLGMLVRCVIVADQMQLLALGCLPVDLAQKLQPLDVAMTCLALADDCPIEDVQCCE